MANVLPRPPQSTGPRGRKLAATPVQAGQDTRRSLVRRGRRFLDLQAGSIWNDLSQLLPERRGFVLDVGCGAQPYRSLVNPEATYQGIDYADAERHFGYSMPDTTYYEGDRWPISDASVDVVLSTETLEHVPDPPLFLAEAFRCLKPGGTLDPHRPVRGPLALHSHTITGDSRRRDCERLLSAAGFTGIAVFARGNVVTVACYKVMALLLRLVMPQTETLWTSIVLRALGILMLPFLILLATIANISLLFDGGDDCLGYTVIALR